MLADTLQATPAMSFLELVGVATLLVVALALLWSILEHAASNIPVTGSLEGKAVIVTGCDTGLGRHIALSLASDHGVKVFAGCLTESGAEKLSEESDRPITTFVMDVTSDASVAIAVDFVQRHLDGRPLFAVINNAGVGKGFLVEFTPLEVYQSVMDVNFLGVVRVTRAFLPLLVEAKGRVVNIISCSALGAAATMSAYASSKFAAAAFSDSARRELKSQGVKVVQILPGFLKTDMVTAALDCTKKLFHSQSREVQERYGGDKWINAFVSRCISAVKFCGPVKSVMPPVLEALRSRYPKVRYFCGLDAMFIFRPMSLLPPKMMDFIFSLTTM